ncbi:MAG: hypothetical protein Q8O83_02840 [bacterium]|nr:hypothetical protein [bacterium]
MKLYKKIKLFFKKLNEPIFYDTIKVHTAPSGTQYVHTIDLILSRKEKELLYAEAEKLWNNKTNKNS